MSEPAPTPLTDRKAFDKLLRDRAADMRKVARATTPGDAPAPTAAEVAAEVKRLNDGAKLFADTVDRELGDLGYEQVVLVRGDKGTKVVPREAYYREPDYHRTGLGTIDFEQDGESLLHYLRTGQPWQPRP